MLRVKLDPLDLQILRELQNDGRMTNVELARRVGISAPPCLRRVRTLEDAGYLTGYHAALNAEALGYEVTFFALVGLTAQSESVLDAFQSTVTAWPEVRECVLARGPHDFVLKLVARNIAHENDLTLALTAVENVATVQTLQVVCQFKTAGGVPLDCGDCGDCGGDQPTERHVSETQ